jgi:hypothetical protein
MGRELLTNPQYTQNRQSLTVLERSHFNGPLQTRQRNFTKGFLTRPFTFNQACPGRCPNEADYDSPKPDSGVPHLNLRPRILRARFRTSKPP